MSSSSSSSVKSLIASATSVPINVYAIIRVVTPASKAAPCLLLTCPLPTAAIIPVLAVMYSKIKNLVMNPLKALNPLNNIPWFGFTVPLRIPIKALSVAPIATDLLSASVLASFNSVAYLFM